MEKHLLNILTGKLKMANKDRDIPLSNEKKPSDTYDQLGEFLTKTLAKLHEEDLKKFNNKNKKK